MLDIAINIYVTLPYYAGIMLNALMTCYAQNYASIIGGSLVPLTSWLSPLPTAML